MVPLGYIFLVLGLIIGIYGEVRFLVVAYNRNLWWFFGCLFIPLATWVFLFLHLKATIKPFGVSLFGLVVAGLGCWMSGVIWPH
jgi:FtsH-binding integral membrane protein